MYTVYRCLYPVSHSNVWMLDAGDVSKEVGQPISLQVHHKLCGFRSPKVVELIPMLMQVYIHFVPHVNSGVLAYMFRCVYSSFTFNCMDAGVHVQMYGKLCANAFSHTVCHRLLSKRGNTRHIVHRCLHPLVPGRFKISLVWIEIG